MPTILNNRASAAYTYAGAGAPASAVSNTVSTTLLDEYAITSNKDALKETFRAGENLAYVVRATNTGLSSLYNITVTDDLGGLGTPLSYIDESARAYIDGVNVPVQVSTSGDALVLTAQGPLATGESAIFVYMVRVDEALDVDEDTIVNTAAVTANGGSPTGPTITADPTATATVTRESYAELSVLKAADQATVASGDTLTYTFTLTNTGSETAENVVLTDTFPQNFTVTGITVTTDGVTTVYPASDYTVDASNTLTLPNASGAPITVPAAADSGAGVTTVTVTGTVTA